MRVNARSGLRLRAGPSTSFDILQLLPLCTSDYVLKNPTGWPLVDLQGDGIVDVYVGEGFLVDANILSAGMSSVQKKSLVQSMWLS